MVRASGRFGSSLLPIAYSKLVMGCCFVCSNSSRSAKALEGSHEVTNFPFDGTFSVSAFDGIVSGPFSILSIEASVFAVRPIQLFVPKSLTHYHPLRAFLIQACFWLTERRGNSLNVACPSTPRRRLLAVYGRGR